MIISKAIKALFIHAAIISILNSGLIGGIGAALKKLNTSTESIDLAMIDNLVSSFKQVALVSLVIGIILIVIVVFLLLIPVFGDKLIELIEFINFNDTLTNIFSFTIHLSKTPLSWLLIFFLIKVVYTMAPDDVVPSTCTTKGSLFTTFGLVISTSIYSAYVNNMAHYDVLYGGLSHFVVLMIWFYIISYILTIGIAINGDDVKIWKNNKK